MQLIFTNPLPLKHIPTIFSHVLYISSPESRDPLGLQWKAEISWLKGPKKTPASDQEDGSGWEIPR